MAKLAAATQLSILKDLTFLFGYFIHAAQKVSNIFRELKSQQNIWESILKNCLRKKPINRKNYFTICTKIFAKIGEKFFHYFHLFTFGKTLRSIFYLFSRLIIHTRNNFFHKKQEISHISFSFAETHF
jgi:hypothetical protein